MNRPTSQGPDSVSSRADLHVHTKYSDKPGDFYIRLLGSAESYTEPLTVYQRARQAGMDFVTISDHDCIAGALEIAHLPGTFLSTEATVTFPEDGCKIHCLVIGITEQQFAEIDRLRENIYDFGDYLQQENILYSVAHPLYQVNDQMTVDHVEKLLLLFDRFEGINGTRHPRAADLVATIWGSLTPEHMAEMEERQGLAARSPKAWQKVFTGGSDDHGGAFIASAWTETPAARTVEEFLAHLHEGRHSAGGLHGSSLQLAYSFLAIARESYRDRFASREHQQQDLLNWLFSTLLGDLPKSQRTLPQLKLLLDPFLRFGSRRTFDALEASLIQKLSKTIAEPQATSESGSIPPREVQEQQRAKIEQQTFDRACRVNRRVSALFMSELAESFSAGRFLECLKSVPLAGATTISHWPYVAAFKTQHKDERFLQSLAERFPAARSQRRRSEKKLWVTDTVDDVNGVARTVQAVAAVARNKNCELTLATCLEKTPHLQVRIKNFQPVTGFRMPEYPEIQLFVPCLLELMQYIEREEFSEVIVSTPGPLGLAARLAGQWLGLRVTSIYHTDFPHYVRTLTGHPKLEEWVWHYMRWFYNPLDTVFVPSRYYMQTLHENGLESQRLKYMPRGVELNQFSPEHRRDDYWSQWGLEPGFQFLYVGRLSKEKNVEFLLQAFCKLSRHLQDVSLAIVGDGAMREVLERDYAHPRICFTGYLHNEELSQAYASSDAFVFPSTTDTFGNVVLEAHASGLPAIVSDKGGPSEIVDHGRSGLVVSMQRVDQLVEAMQTLLLQPKTAKLMGEYAREQAARRDWEAIFEILWTDDVPPKAHRTSPPQSALSTSQ